MSDWELQSVSHHCLSTPSHSHTPPVSNVDIIKQFSPSNVRVGWLCWDSGWENSRIKWFIRVRCHESSINSKPSSYIGALCVNRFYQTTRPDQSKHFTGSQRWLLAHQLWENLFPPTSPHYLRPYVTTYDIICKLWGVTFHYPLHLTKGDITIMT